MFNLMSFPYFHILTYGRRSATVGSEDNATQVAANLAEVLSKITYDHKGPLQSFDDFKNVISLVE